MGMCGPYVALCTARIAPAGPRGGSPVLGRILFNAGRVAAYVAIGGLVGAFGSVALAAAERARLGGVVSLAAGLVTVVFGVALAGWIRDPADILTKLGLQALIRGGVREASGAPRYLSSVLLGALQGSFPCALVYGAASRAVVGSTVDTDASTHSTTICTRCLHHTSAPRAPTRSVWSRLMLDELAPGVG